MFYSRPQRFTRGLTERSWFNRQTLPRLTRWPDVMCLLKYPTACSVSLAPSSWRSLQRGTDHRAMNGNIILNDELFPVRCSKWYYRQRWGCERKRSGPVCRFDLLTSDKTPGLWTEIGITSYQLRMFFNPLNWKLVYITLKKSVRSSNKTQHFTITKINSSLLFKNIRCLFSEKM
jgi:hypothetical protein